MNITYFLLFFHFHFFVLGMADAFFVSLLPAIMLARQWIIALIGVRTEDYEKKSSVRQY
jgi:hypothetical protein